MELHPKGKMLVLALAVCVGFSVILAETLAAADLDHDCIGEGCPVCLQIETVSCFLKALKTASLFAFLTALPVFTALIRQKTAAFTTFLQSPIALKVRFTL